MIRSIFTAAKPDIFTATDRSHGLRFVVGAMALMATLILFLGLWIDQTVRDWRGDASGEVTIELAATMEEAELTALTDKLSVAPFIASARTLPKAEVLAMLEPWLGDLAQDAMGSFDLPRLVAVKLAPDTTTSQLAEWLKADYQSAFIDDHGATLAALLALSRAVEFTIIGLIGLIAATTIAAVSFATRAAIQSHRNVITIVHQIGATDPYISAEFERHFFRVGLVGALLGWAVALALAFGIGLLAPEMAGLAAAEMQLTPVGYTLLGSVPILLALVATFTARLTVMRQLQELM